VINQISVPEEEARLAKRALDNMLLVSWFYWFLCKASVDAGSVGEYFEYVIFFLPK
jgi:hypothetical protein